MANMPISLDWRKGNGTRKLVTPVKNQVKTNFYLNPFPSGPLRFLLGLQHRRHFGSSTCKEHGNIGAVVGAELAGL